MIDNVAKRGSRFGVDMASNTLKEFRPDLERKFSNKHNSAKL
jgi:hypothetical protein